MITSETYRLIVLGRGGMYTYGGLAATPELARLTPGYLIRERAGAMARLGIEQVRFALDRDGREYVDQTILIEAEGTPGEWAIGPDGGR